jgi:hypothetical protein
MISRPFHGRLSFKAGIGAVTIAALAVTLFSATSAKAQTATQISEAQADINAQLVAPKTIANASASTLALAVSNAIQVGNTDTALNAAVYITAVLSPVNGKVSATQKAAAATIVGTVINRLVVDGQRQPASSGTNSFSKTIGALTDSALNVGGSTTTLALSLAQREATLKAALSAVSGGPALTATGGALTTQQILAADTAIGTAVASDSFLQTLAISTKNSAGLITLLDTAITGVDGPKGTSALVIPQAAGDFTTGILESSTTGALPNNLTPLTFTEDLIKPLKANASAAEYIANAVGSDSSFTTDLSTLETGLITAYPTDVAKITQGLVATITRAQGETARIGFISNAAASNITKATTILEGGVFTDPNYAAEFTQAVGNDIYSSVNAKGATTGHALLAADATGIATGVGSILGQDGASLAEVSGTFAQDYIATGLIPVTKAAALANSFFTSAVNSKLPAADFISVTGLTSGGTFNIGTLQTKTLRAGITASNVIDMEAIADQFASAIIQDYSSLAKNGINTAAGASAAGSQIGILARDIATITGAEVFGSPSEFVSAAIAGSIAKTVDDFGLTATSFNVGKNVENAETVILADLQTDLKALNTSSSGAVDAAISGAAASNTVVSYGKNPVGFTNIAADETPVTNL